MANQSRYRYRSRSRSQLQSQQVSEELKLEAIRWHQKLQEITYLEAGQHMRALNQLMWQIPSFIIAVNGGLWYATTLANDSSLWIIFSVLAICDISTIIILFRLRWLIGKKIEVQSDIENPYNNVVLRQISSDVGINLTPCKSSETSSHIVVGCWLLMLVPCIIINLAGICNPALFSKVTLGNTYKALIRSVEPGIVIEVVSGESK